MPNRIIKESIRTSKKVNSLTDFQFRVWTYLITYVDDFGRGSADPELLKGLVFPRKTSLTEAQISNALDDLANSGMITIYEADGELYFCFPNWDKHQQIRAKKSKFPEPENICNQMKSSDSKCPRNPIQSESNPNPNPIVKSTRAKFIPPTFDEVKAYAQKRNSSVDPTKFFEYFSEGGWVDSKGNAVKNWKQKFITWENGSNKKSDNPSKSQVAKKSEEYKGEGFFD